MKKFQVIFDEFNEVIQGVNLIVDYYENKSTLKSTFNSCIDWNKLDTHNKKIIKENFFKINFPQNVYLNSQYIILCASYESFLKSCLKQTLLGISETEDSSKILPSLKNMNSSYSGNLLSTLTGEKKTYIEFNPKLIIENLYLLENGDKSFKLNPEIADLVPSVLLFENVLDFLNKCDLEITWYDITDNSSFKSIFKDNKTVRKNLAQNKHKEIYRMRNNIAHEGCSTTMTTQNIKELIKFLIPFTQSLINTINKLMNEKYN